MAKAWVFHNGKIVERLGVWHRGYNLQSMRDEIIRVLDGETVTLREARVIGKHPEFKAEVVGEIKKSQREWFNWQFRVQPHFEGLKPLVIDGGIISA